MKKQLENEYSPLNLQHRRSRSSAKTIPEKLK